ncbi:energy transducer TonB family protein [Noviluteimonas dokdonensis]|nr:energy transducer TonB [Lysobacter dokdonensis]
MPPLGYVQSAVGRAFQPRIDPETKESKIPQLEREPRLIFTIDEQGNPIDVGIQRSSRDRNVDRALLDLGRRMKFTAMSGCGPRRGVVPIGIAP